MTEHLSAARTDGLLLHRRCGVARGRARAQPHVGALQGRPLTAAPPLLEIEALRVAYGQTTALDGFDLSVEAGELFVLLGGSGSGKTTLLRTIAGFLRPASGSIRLRGESIDALPPHRRPVNTMFQSYALFPHMTVADNIAFGLRRLGLDRRATPRAGRGDARSRAARRLRLPPAAPALGRPAAAGGAGPQPRAPSRAAAAGRAAVRARPGAARRDARRTDARAAAARHDLHPRHARPAGGADDGDPHRRHAARQAGAGGRSRRRVRAARPAASSPSSWASATSCPRASGRRTQPRRSSTWMASGLSARRPGLTGPGAPCLIALRPERLRIGTDETSGDNQARGYLSRPRT